MTKMPRIRTAKAIAQRMESEDEATEPTKLQPTPEMLTVEYLKPIVDEYRAAMKLHDEWKAEQFTPTGKRKTGKALEKALALPKPPFPEIPLFHYEHPDGFKELSEEVQDLWFQASGFPAMTKPDEVMHHGEERLVHHEKSKWW